MGGYQNKVFLNFSDSRFSPCEYIDTSLGISRGLHPFWLMNPENMSNRDTIKILCLGNSTTDFSFYGIHAWPYFLQLNLLKSAKQYSVLNGGVYYYTSTQEMLSLLRDGLEVKPNLVISYSGLVDSVISSAGYPWTMNYYRGILAKMYSEYKLNDSSIEDIYYGPQYSMHHNYVKNQMVMHSVCESYGIKFVNILQPTMISGKYRCDDVDKRFLSCEYINQEITRSRTFYSDVRKSLKSFSWFYDFSNLFDGHSSCFYEWSHTNEKGNNIISGAIYALIENILGEV